MTHTLGTALMTHILSVALRSSNVTLDENTDMCQSSLVDEKAEKITKGLSDQKKKKSQDNQKEIKTIFHDGRLA